jgi:hypothetical protein
MRAPHATDESLLDLLNGLMLPNDVESTMGHIRQCRVCENRMRELLREREMLVANGFPVVRSGSVEMPRRPRRRKLALSLGTLAAALLVVLLAHGHRVNEPEPYWIPVGDQERTILRSDPGDAGATIDDVLRAYVDRDAATAVDQLRKMGTADRSHTANTLRDLYLASALVNCGHAAEGLDVLRQPTVANMPRPWRLYARWVTFLALSDTGRKDEAMSLLEELSAEPGPVGDLARSRRSRK